MIKIIDETKEISRLDKLINKSVPKGRLCFVISKSPALMLPGINVGRKFLLMLENVEGCDVHMSNSYFSINQKLFWHLDLEWKSQKIRKAVIIDVIANKDWLKILFNTKTLAFTSVNIPRTVIISDVITDAIKPALHLADMLPIK